MHVRFHQKTVIGLLCVVLSSWHPLPHFGAYATQERPTFYQQSPATSPLINESRFGRTLLYYCPQYVQILLGTYRDSFFDAYPHTSNSKSLTNLCKRSSSRSLLSRCSCLGISDVDRYICEDPSPEPECSPSRLCLQSLFLLCLLSCQLEVLDEPPGPLSA